MRRRAFVFCFLLLLITPSALPTAHARQDGIKVDRRGYVSATLPPRGLLACEACARRNSDGVICASCPPPPFSFRHACAARCTSCSIEADVMHYCVCFQLPQNCLPLRILRNLAFSATRTHPHTHTHLSCFSKAVCGAGILAGPPLPNTYTHIHTTPLSPSTCFVAVCAAPSLTKLLHPQRKTGPRPRPTPPLTVRLSF